MQNIKYGPGRPKKGEVRPPKPESRFGKGKERPQMWVIGSDAGSYKHSMYHPWQLSRAQANFRKEEWNLSFEEYYELWKDDWSNRGRLPENMCMTREDPEKAWDASNTVIVTRYEHLMRLNHNLHQREVQYARDPVNTPRPPQRGRPLGAKNIK